MKNLGTVQSPKDVANKEYVDNATKKLDEKLNNIEALSTDEIDQILSLSDEELDDIITGS